MNYVDLRLVEYAGRLLEAAERSGQAMVCEYGEPICGERAEYLIPDAPLAIAGQDSILVRPAMFCRRHVAERLGHSPEEQPPFRRFPPTR